MIISPNNTFAIIEYIRLAFGAGIFAWLYVKFWKGTFGAPGLKKAVWAAAIFYAFALCVQIVARYYFFAAAFGQKLLLPHQMWAYFWFLELRADFAPYLTALVVGFFMFWAATLTNRRFQGFLFVEPDRYLLFIAALVCGWPNFVLYFFLVAILSVPYSLFISVRQKSISVRIILTHVLIISIPLILIFGNYVASRLNFWMLGWYG